MKYLLRLPLFLLLGIFWLSAYGQWTGTGPIYTLDDDVGIGTSSPSENLTIEDATGAGLGLVSNGTSKLQFSSTSLILGELSYTGTEMKLKNIGGFAGTGDLSLETGTDMKMTTANSLSMIIKNNGNVGIGEENPIEKLTIRGSSFADVGIMSTGSQELRFKKFTGGIPSAQVQGRISHNGTDFTIENENTGGGDLIFKTNNSTRMTILDNGNLGIGTSSPSFKLQVAGNADITGELTAASDLKLKKNIQGIDDALPTVNQLKPVSYDFRTEEFPEMGLSERRKMGLIAQDMEAVLPALVRDAGSATKVNGDVVDIKSINYMELIPLLIKSVQELNDEVESLKAQIKALENL